MGVGGEGVGAGSGGPVLVVPKSGMLPFGAASAFRPRFRSRSRSSCPMRAASAKVLSASVAAGSVGVDTRSVGRALFDIAELSGR